MHAKTLLETRQKVQVCVPTAIGNDATRDSARIDLNQTSLQSGLPPVRDASRKPCIPIAATAATISEALWWEGRLPPRHLASELAGSNRSAAMIPGRPASMA